MVPNPTEARLLHYTLQLLITKGYPGWGVKLNNSAHTAGVANFTNRTITFSRRLIKARSWEDSVNTAKHEVAHVIAGKAAGHGPFWQEIFRSMGGDGERHVDPSSVDQSKMGLKYVGVCKNGHKVHRARMVAYERSCTRCHTGFSKEHLFDWFDARTGEKASYAKIPSRKKTTRLGVVAA